MTLEEFKNEARGLATTATNNSDFTMLNNGAVTIYIGRDWVNIEPYGMENIENPSSEVLKTALALFINPFYYAEHLSLKFRQLTSHVYKQLPELTKEGYICSSFTNNILNFKKGNEYIYFKICPLTGKITDSRQLN